MKSLSIAAFLLLTFQTSVCEASWLDDYIESLPGYGKTPTPQFSGFLNASEGCDTDTNGPDCFLHYWFALAEHEPAKAPVVLFLNGGPGSSSILGFLQEEGPLLINATGGLMENPWSWTKYANLLALEAPIGVGYSYCTRQAKDHKPCVNTDRYTASASRAALVDFFTRKFPEFQSNDFYITGESYAGVYIPTLTKEILDHAAHLINLKGIAVGDPCTDNTAQRDSMDSLWYAGKYGLIDDEIYDLLWNQCHVRLPNLLTRGGVQLVASQCNRELAAMENWQQRRQRAHELVHQVLWNDNVAKLLQQQQQQKNTECLLAFRKYLLSSSHGLSQSWKDLYIDDYSLFAPVSSLEDEHMAAWMSRDDVRAALHVQDAPTTTWPQASVEFDYTKEYDACNWDPDDNNNGVNLNISMIDIYQEIVPKLDRTWIYNGDSDPCVSYEGTRLAVKQIGFPELDGGSYRPWFYNQTAASTHVWEQKAPLFGPNLVSQNMGAQFAGHVVDYYGGLSFVTFHGSGHMVPQFRPQAALHFLQCLMDHDRMLLAPLLSNNQTLVTYSDEDFRNVMEEWTESARKPPYVDAAVASSGGGKGIGTPGRLGDVVVRKYHGEYQRRLGGFAKLL